jgi:hypothetical protein
VTKKHIGNAGNYFTNGELMHRLTPRVRTICSANGPQRLRRKNGGNPFFCRHDGGCPLLGLLLLPSQRPAELMAAFRARASPRLRAKKGGSTGECAVAISCLLGEAPGACGRRPGSF